jgi:DNA repair exonuclease SbcCD ATPase subunit
LVLFVDAIETNADPANSGVGAPPDVARSLAMLLRVDPSYGAASRKRAEIEHQLSGLGLALDEMSELERRISNPKEVMARKAEPLSGSRDEKLERLKSEVSEVSRLLRDARGSSADPKKLEPLERELETLQLKLDAATAARAVANRSAGKADSPADLALLLKQDRRRAQALVQAAEVARARLEKEQLGLARDALERLDKRMSRLLRRARLGRVETVLGKKRALEVEIEALSQGLLPRDAVDSLDAARYLQDDEEYWPFDGEDWEDEYVGGEGLR